MTTPQHPLFLLIAFMLACLALAACSPSAMAGSMTGGSIGLLLLGMLLAGGLTTQAACTDDDTDTSKADMAQDMDVGPCLSAVLPDMDEDMDVGPCLSPSLDMDVGPCLSFLPPDMGDDMKQDMDIGPCLSSPLDMGDEMGALTPTPTHTQDHTGAPANEREQLLAKLADRLPADVLAKLGGSSDKA